MSLSLTRYIKCKGSAVGNFNWREGSGLQGGISIPAEFATQMPHGAKLKGGLACPAPRARSWAQLVLAWPALDRGGAESLVLYSAGSNQQNKK